MEGSTTINASNKPSSTEEITAIHSTLTTPVSLVNRLSVAFGEHEGPEGLHDIQLLSLLFRVFLASPLLEGLRWLQMQAQSPMTLIVAA